MNEWARCIRCVEPVSVAGRNGHPKRMLGAGHRAESQQRGDLRHVGEGEEWVHRGCLERDFCVMNRKEAGRMEGGKRAGVSESRKVKDTG